MRLVGRVVVIGNLIEKEVARRLSPYIVTGSIASMAYGEPRLTNDIDIVTEMEGDNG